MPSFTYVGDLLVELLLRLAELVGNGLGDPLGEQLLALERQQILLDHPPHQIRRVDLVDLLVVAPLEDVLVEQREEQLEVLLHARVRRRGHQQQVRV